MNVDVVYTGLGHSPDAAPPLCTVMAAVGFSQDQWPPEKGCDKNSFLPIMWPCPPPQFISSVEPSQ